MYKTGRAVWVPQRSQGRRRAARASDLGVVRTGPVCCEQRCADTCIYPRTDILRISAVSYGYG